MTNGHEGPSNKYSLDSLDSQNPEQYRRTLTSLADLPVHSIESVSSSDLLRVEGRLGRTPDQILIDRGSRGNFISNQLASRAKLSGDPQTTQTIILADGT